MNKSAFIQGYSLQKEAQMTPEDMARMVGGALGITSGLLSNYLLSSLFGYKGSWANYLTSGAAGGVIGATGADAAARKARYFHDNPDKLAEILEKVENSPRLEQWHEWQKKSPLMKPVRQAVGRVVTNVKRPKGYELEQIKDVYKQHGLKGILQAALEDRPLYRPLNVNRRGEVDSPAAWHATREGKTRAYWDLPQREGLAPLEKYYEQVGNDPKRLRIRTDTPEGRDYLENELTGMFERAGPDKVRKGYYSGKPFTVDEGFTTSTMGMGGVYVRPEGNRLRWEDTWDFHTTRKPEYGKLHKGGVQPYKTTEIRVSGDTKAQKRRRYAVNAVMHHLRNIADRAIGNPVTTEGSLPATLSRADVDSFYAAPEDDFDYGTGNG